VTAQPQLIPVADLSEVQAEGATKMFPILDGAGHPTEGFLVRFGGALHAYINRCPHVPLSLDYGDGQVFDEEQRWLICRNHGAVFEPDTGRCVAGPCAGASLQRLTLHIVGTIVAVAPPQPPPDLD